MHRDYANRLKSSVRLKVLIHYKKGWWRFRRRLPIFASKVNEFRTREAIQVRTVLFNYVSCLIELAWLELALNASKLSPEIFDVISKFRYHCKGIPVRDTCSLLVRMKT